VSAGSWSWNPEALVLIVAAAAYGTLAARTPPPRWRVLCFGAGTVLLAAALVTPLDTIARHYLLAGHLLQNVVLAEWAPALLVLGIPRAAAVRLEARPGFRRATHPLLTLGVWLATYFVWHIPALYDAALRHQHSLLPLEHACYLAAGLAFWWPVVHRRMPSGAKAAYLFAAFVLASPLGLLLALVPHPAYDFYAGVPRLWGLSRLADQQIAGVTMAAEQAVVFFAAFATFFLRFLREEEFSSARRAPG
jgi:cytochrome c oxidase assembly factor CtaG